LGKDDIIDQLKKELDSLSSQLKSVEEKLSDLSGEVQEMSREHAGDLQGLIDEARAKAEKAKVVADDVWVHVKDDLELTARALKNSVNYFLSHYRKK
jgi:phage tail tape-measure protein